LLMLSDGQPNMDLRGHCSGNDCPFQLPEDIAHDLLVPSGHKPVKTYVIGFALNTLTVGTNTVDCSALTQADLDTTPSALCAANPDNPSLQACCNLARIAVAGDDKADRHAFLLPTARSCAATSRPFWVSNSRPPVARKPRSPGWREAARAR